MLARQLHPTEAYRRVELDARVEGADGVELTRLCLERALGELDRARRAYGRRDHPTQSDALTRAGASLSALAAGVEHSNPLREPLLHLYGSAEAAVRMANVQFQEDVLIRVQTDLRDILALL